ncbi:MAG: hypothetical protein ACRC62_32315 [Microcoleus sp.]
MANTHKVKHGAMVSVAGVDYPGGEELALTPEQAANEHIIPFIVPLGQQEGTTAVEAKAETTSATRKS